jgi:hypothetical protein
MIKIGFKDGQKFFWLKLPNFYRQNEKILFGINEFLQKHKKKITSLKKIVVVNGPGSFASIRVALTISNTLGLILKIPVIGINMNLKLDDQDLFEKGLKGAIKKNNFKLATPFYGKPPNISRENKKF